MYSPSPPAPMAAAIVAEPTPTTAATRMPGHDGRQGERQLDLSQQQFARRHAHRDAGLADGRIDARSPAIVVRTIGSRP